MKRFKLLFSPSEYKNLYLSENPDVAGSFWRYFVWAHFAIFGHREGRFPDTSARRRVSREYATHEAVLELSPWTRPFFTGPNVKYCDILSTKELKERAATLGIEASSIPEMDYQISPNDFSNISEKFDLIVSSHVLEHQPNLIGHLKSVHALLKPQGLYLVALPDRRFTFDYFMAESRVVEAIQAHLDNRVVHTLGSLIEHRAFTTHSDALRHWREDHGEFDSNREERVKLAINEFEKSMGAYIDVHAWYFTPDSIQTLIRDLSYAGFPLFSVERVFETEYGSYEFFVALRKIESADF